MTKDICVVNKKGLHARPATLFAETASEYSGDVKISFNGKKVTGKSLIALLSLSVPRDGIVSVSVEGDDEQAMMDRLSEVLGKNYET